MASEIVALPAGQEVGESKLSGRGPYVPDSTEGLRDVFIHMWSRLNEVAFIVGALELQEPGTDAYRSTLDALKQVADVNRAYAHMQSLLQAAQEAAP